MHLLDSVVTDQKLKESLDKVVKVVSEQIKEVGVKMEKFSERLHSELQGYIHVFIFVC